MCCTSICWAWRIYSTVFYICFYFIALRWTIMSVSRFHWLSDYHSLLLSPALYPSLYLVLWPPNKCLAYFEGPTAWPALPHSLRWWTFCGALLGNLLSVFLCVSEWDRWREGEEGCVMLSLFDAITSTSTFASWCQGTRISSSSTMFHICVLISLTSPKSTPKKPRLGPRTVLDLPQVSTVDCSQAKVPDKRKEAEQKRERAFPGCQLALVTCIFTFRALLGGTLLSLSLLYQLCRLYLP